MNPMSTAATPLSTSMDPCFDADWSATNTPSSPSLPARTPTSSRISDPLCLHFVRDLPVRTGYLPQSCPVVSTRSNHALLRAVPYFPTDIVEQNLLLASSGRRLDPRPSGSGSQIDRNVRLEDCTSQNQSSAQGYGYYTPQRGFSDVPIPQDDQVGHDGCSLKTASIQGSSTASSMATQAEFAHIAQNNTPSSFFCFRTSRATVDTANATSNTAAMLPTSQLPLLNLDTNDDDDDIHNSWSRQPRHPRIPMRNHALPLPLLDEH